MPKSSSESSSSGSDSSGSGSESESSQKSSPNSKSLDKHSPDRSNEDPQKRRRGDESGSKSPSPKRSRKDRVDESVVKDSKKPEMATEVSGAGKEPDTIMTRTGGAYIPPAKLRMMQESITDKASLAFQVTIYHTLLIFLLKKLKLTFLAQNESMGFFNCFRNN
jgi:pre-mRNA-splicing factor CWC22